MPLQPLLPPRLAAGDTIAVVSPSSPVAAARPRRFGRGVAELERRGFRVRVGEHALARRAHTAGTVEERLADLHAAFADPEVHGIVCAIGGFNANGLVAGLDYDLVAASPKVFCGYSDVTALHAAIWARTGLAVVLGPGLLPQLGEYGGTLDHTWRWFERVLMRAEPAGEIEPAPEWTGEYTEWDVADDRPRRLEPSPGPRTIRAGTGEGPLVAGNLATLLALAGTSWWPELDGVLLCLEDDAEETPATIDRALTQLRLMGVLERVAGLALGRFQVGTGFSKDDPLDAVVLEATCGTEYPIACDFDFGHTDPMVPLPWGVHARLDAGETARLSLLGPAVVERDAG